MATHRLTSTAGSAYERTREAAADWLGRGGLALLPAEGLYGLHACLRGSCPPALDLLRRAKGHSPPERPYIVLVASPADARPLLGVLPPGSADLMRRAWPGPLTLILPAQNTLPGYLTQDGCVAVRCPGSLLLRELAGACRGHLVTTSANRAGAPPPAALAEVAREVREACGILVDGGRLAGRGSTLARFAPDGRLTVLRPGLWVPTP